MMQSLRSFNFGIFIAVSNIFVYSIAFFNIFASIVLEFIGDFAKSELNADHRYILYVTLYKALLLILSLIMIITSINLFRGLIKKSMTLLNSWLVLSSCVLLYQAIFLLDQALFSLAYGYTEHSPLILLGLSVIFGLHIVCIRNILKFYLNLHRDNILQREEFAFIKAPTLNSQTYLRNLSQNDPSILSPLNDQDLRKQYENSNSVNLNQFEI